MVDETKIEVKSSMLKGFVTNPISWVVGAIAIGTFVFNLGGSTANKKNDVSDIKDNQVEMKSDIKTIQDALSLQNQSWTLFSINYDKDKKKDSIFKAHIFRSIIVLDTAMSKHLRQTNRTEERYQFLEDQLKKNSDLYNQIQLKEIQYFITNR